MDKTPCSLVFMLFQVPFENEACHPKFIYIMKWSAFKQNILVQNHTRKKDKNIIKLIQGDPKVTQCTLLSHFSIKNIHVYTWGNTGTW